MNITKRRTHGNKVEFKSVNETIHVALNQYNGPELTLSDGSVVMFYTHAGYYTLLNEKCIRGEEFDLDVLKILSNKIVEDDVANEYYDFNQYINHVAVYTISTGDIVFVLGM